MTPGLASRTGRSTSSWTRVRWMACGALVSLATSGCGPGTPTGPLVVTPHPLDFGRVGWTATPLQTVTVRNASGRPLVLRDPKFDCKCFFVAKAPPVVRLQPGQTVELTVGLRSIDAAPGPFKKTMTMVCDDPKAPTLDVPVTGAIVDFRLITPRDVDLGNVNPAKPVERTVTVRGGANYFARVLTATTTDPALELDVRGVDVGSDVLIRTKVDASPRRIGAEVKLLVEVKAPGEPTGQYLEIVNVRGSIGGT